MKIAALIITAKYDKKTAELIDQLSPYADVLVQTNAEKSTSRQNPKAKFSYYKWTDDFAAARNALHQEMLKDDYTHWLWVDTGDTITGIESLKGTVQLMETNNIDVLYCKYEYEVDDNDELVADQWRERIVSTKVKGEWKGAIHETFVPATPVKHVRDDRLVWVHEKKTEAEKDKSRERNHTILKRLVYGSDNKLRKDVDPRDLYYLAMSYFGYKDFKTAIPLFLQHIEASGWDEERYRSWKKIAECHNLEQNYDKAISAYSAANRLFPEWKDGWLGIAECYHWMNQHEKCLEYLEIAALKKVPDTLSVIDPTVYTYRPKMMAAVSAAHMGKVEAAYKMALEVQKIQPNYPVLKQYLPEFEEAYLENQALDRAKWLAKYTRMKKGDGLKIFSALPSNLHGHPGLLGEIQTYMKPVKHGDKSIVFITTAATEPWGPDTAHKGMGGSEEAILYLSRELAKQGWEVTVYNDREEEYLDGAWNDQKYNPERCVTWKPWTLFNPADEFNVIIAWRNPNFFKATPIKAKFKGVDMHDTPMGHQEIHFPETVDKFFFKSKFQAKMSGLPADKYVVIPNGIKTEQFS